MALNALQREIVNVMPYARCYGRALTGDTEFSDLILSQSASNLIRRTLVIRTLLPKKIILPALLSEFHRQLDSTQHGSTPTPIVDSLKFDDYSDKVAYEKIDRALLTLSDSQRRVYLLVTLTQFNFSVVARMLSIKQKEAADIFHQAHCLITEFIVANSVELVA